MFVWRRPGGRRVTIVCVVPRMRFSEALREQRRARPGSSCRAAAPRVPRGDRRRVADPHAVHGRQVPARRDRRRSRGARDKLESCSRAGTIGCAPRVQALPQARAPRRARDYLATVTSAQDIWTRYATRFPESYKSVPPEIAILDIGLMEKLDDEGERLRVGIMTIGEGEHRYTSLRIARTRSCCSTTSCRCSTGWRCARRRGSPSGWCAARRRSAPTCTSPRFEMSGSDGRGSRTRPRWIGSARSCSACCSASCSTIACSGSATSRTSTGGRSIC